MGTVLVVIGLVLLALIVSIGTVSGFIIVYKADKIVFCCLLGLLLSALLVVVGSLLQEAGL